jgi:hypothetical protein
VYVCGVFREREKKKSFAMELVQQQYVCGVFREREKKIFYNGTCAAAVRVCGVFREREKKKKKNLLQWNLCSNSTCVVCLEKEKKKIFCNGTYAAAFFIEYFNDHLYIRDF